jgi:hypothetical protein
MALTQGSCSVSKNAVGLACASTLGHIACLVSHPSYMYQMLGQDVHICPVIADNVLQADRHSHFHVFNASNLARFQVLIEHWQFCSRLTSHQGDS